MRRPTIPATPARTHRPLTGPRLPHISDTSERVDQLP